MSGVDVEIVGAKTPPHNTAVAERAGRWLDGRIDRSPALAFALLTVLYAIVVATLSSLKLLWLDELITLHIASLGSVGAIWNALAQGADPNPPITHILVHYSRMLFGDHEFAYRLPSFAGYWVGLLSLFVYLLRLLPATWALAGTVLSMTMAALDYSFESRSYAIFYGLAMLAMLCWSVAVDRETRASVRRLAWAGMVFALAAGISTNYFAVLAFVPIAAGELTRTMGEMHLRRRKSPGLRNAAPVSLLRVIDFPIWIGLAAAGSTLLAYRAMIAHSIAQFAPYAWNKVSLDQVFDSYTEVVEIMLYPILALFAFAIVLLLVSRQLAPLCRNCRDAISQNWLGSAMFPASSRLAVPLHEAVAIFTFMAYPILGYIIASIRGGMLSPRFVIPVCFGFAISATLIAFHLFGRLSRSAVVMLCFCLAWFIARESVVAFWYAEQKQAFNKVINDLPQAGLNVPSNAPIAIPDPLLALTFQHYAPAALAARVVFPVDFPAIRTYRHDDSPEENLWAGRNSLYTLPIVPLASFQHSAGKYLIIANDRNWMIRDLAAHRYPVRRLPINTHARDIGGFTPLAHRTPAFYAVAGDADPREFALSKLLPEPFHVADNLPASKSVIPGETAQDDSK